MPSNNGKGNRWPKGVSGNPGGKTKDTIMSQALRIAIRRVVEYKNNPDDPTAPPRIISALPKKHTFADLIVHRLIREALDGNTTAMRELFNRLEGTPDANLTVVADPGVIDEPISVQETLAWIRTIIDREEAAELSESRPH